MLDTGEMKLFPVSELPPNDDGSEHAIVEAGEGKAQDVNFSTADP